jgi:methylenetetrahydrofolate reductase (NADH)
MRGMKAFRDALRQETFVLTADLPLQPDTTRADIKQFISTLDGAVDAVQLIDDRDIVGHMSGLAAAALVLQNDIDPVLHLTSRDRNRVALQAELVGAAVLGVTSLVIQRGEKLPTKGGLRGKGVFDTHETRLTEMARRIGEESGHVSAPGFLIGTYVTAFSPSDDWQAKRIAETVDAGTRLLITQPCLNARLLERYMAKVVERRILHRASMIVEIPLLTRADEARDYKLKNPSALIPDATLASIVGAGDPRAEGIRACAEMLATLKSIPGVSGANIRHRGTADDLLAVIAAAR